MMENSSGASIGVVTGKLLVSLGKNYTHGKYILFPEINLEPAITANNP